MANQINIVSNPRDEHIRLKCIIESDKNEIPVTGTQISASIGSPAQAIISIPYTYRTLDIKPRSRVWLFYKNRGGAQTEDQNWKLCFSGILLATQVIKNSQHRAFNLICADYYCLLNSVYMYQEDMGGGENSFNSAANLMGGVDQSSINKLGSGVTINEKIDNTSRLGLAYSTAGTDYNLPTRIDFGQVFALPDKKNVLIGESSFPYLYPLFRQRLEKLLTEGRNRNIKFEVTETVRSVKFQLEKYAQGRSTPGSIITYVDGVNQPAGHVLGVAVDIAGQVDRLGALARQFNITWGGTWKDFVDKPHFQLPKSEWPTNSWRESVNQGVLATNYCYSLQTAINSYNHRIDQRNLTDTSGFSFPFGSSVNYKIITTKTDLLGINTIVGNTNLGSTKEEQEVITKANKSVDDEKDYTREAMAWGLGGLVTFTFPVNQEPLGPSKSGAEAFTDKNITATKKIIETSGDSANLDFYLIEKNVKDSEFKLTYFFQLKNWTILRNQIFEEFIKTKKLATSGAVTPASQVGGDPTLSSIYNGLTNAFKSTSSFSQALKNFTTDMIADQKIHFYSANEFDRLGFFNNLIEPEDTAFATRFYNQKFITDLIMNRFNNNMGPIISLYEVYDYLMKRVYYTYIPNPVPGMSSNLSGNKIESMIVSPRTYFFDPPKCNKIKKDEYVSLTYERQMLTEVTRLKTTFIPNIAQSSEQGTGQWTPQRGEVISPTEKFGVYNSSDTDLTISLRELQHHEYYTGVTPDWMKFDDYLIDTSVAATVKQGNNNSPPPVLPQQLNDNKVWDPYGILVAAANKDTSTGLYFVGREDQIINLRNEFWKKLMLAFTKVERENRVEGDGGWWKYGVRYAIEAGYSTTHRSTGAHPWGCAVDIHKVVNGKVLSDAEGGDFWYSDQDSLELIKKLGKAAEDEGLNWLGSYDIGVKKNFNYGSDPGTDPEHFMIPIGQVGNLPGLIRTKDGIQNPTKDWKEKYTIGAIGADKNNIIVTTSESAVENTQTAINSLNAASHSEEFCKYYSDYEFFIRRFGQRTGSISMPFSPKIVVGFPAQIEDQYDSTNSNTLLCFVSSVMHVINIQSAEASTSLGLTMLRSKEEDYELLSGLKNYISTEGTQEGTQLTIYKPLGLNEVANNERTNQATLADIKKAYFNPPYKVGGDPNIFTEERIKILTQIDKDRNTSASNYVGELKETAFDLSE